MPDERAEAPDELTEALRVTRSAREAELRPRHTGVAMDERQTFAWLVERSNRLAEIESRAEAPDADEEALWAGLLGGIDPFVWPHEEFRADVEAIIAYRERRYVEALEQERAQFQRETLRTSELHRMLERAGSYIREVDGPDSPLARAFAREISELLAKPINAAAPASPGGGVMVLRNVGDDLQGARDEALREAALDAWYWANSAQPGYDSPALRAQEAAMWQRLGAALYPNAAAPAEENTDAR